MTRSQRKKLTALVSNTITLSNTTLTNNTSVPTSNTAEISEDSTGDALQSCIKLRINEDTHAVQINMPAIFTKSNLLETSGASIAPAGDSGNSVGSLIKIPPTILPTDVGVVADDPESITIISSSFIQPNLYDDDSSDTLVSSANDLKHLEEKFYKLEKEHHKIKADNEWLMKQVNSILLDNNEIYESLTSIEKELLQLSQYGRRESIEILNIPSKFDAKLEETVIKFLKSIGLNDIESYDIVAVHCLNRKVNSKFKSTTARFVNQKDAFHSLNYKKNLALW